MRSIAYLSAAASLTVFMIACNSKPVKKEVKIPQKSDIISVQGIRYTEVKRRFSNGLSFDTMGFQQQPSWIVQFQSTDTVLAYDPGKKIMQPFFLLHDHAAVYNFAKEYFRFKLLSKDSLVFQRLQVKGREVMDDIRSDVNMTFYADSYIKNVLHTDPDKLQRPSKRDTLFISELVAKANRNPDKPDSVFAGRQVAQFTPRDNRITVERISQVDRVNGKTEAYDYLYPKYKLVIPDAYKDFAYEFTVIADIHGKLHLGNFWTNLPEFREVRKKVLEGITSVYLQNLLIIKPGSTLGMPHASEITVAVTGRKSVK
jgi:hypothetical protein